MRKPMKHKNTLLRIRKIRNRTESQAAGEISLQNKPEENLKPVLSVIIYDENQLTEIADMTLDEVFEQEKTGRTAWINVNGLKEDFIRQITENYNLHPLIIEDILNTEHRPKIEDMDTSLLILFKMLSWNDEKDILESEQVSLIVTPKTLISFQERPGDVFNSIRERLRSGKGRLRKSGTDYLACRIMDAVVDQYFPIIEKAGIEIESAEEEIMTVPNKATVHKLHMIKRRLLYLKKNIWPLREAVSALERNESDIIEPATAPYFRDLYQSIIQIIDMLETMKDMNSGLFDIYLSSISNRMNEVMKVLTIIATIFIPLTFIAGIYGMNFEYMPELKWKASYYIILAIMALIAGGMVFVFKRRKWL